MAKTNGTPIAGKIYNSDDYKSTESVSKGLAETHEQTSDTYMEGTVDGLTENAADKEKTDK
ncbi:DUF4025 domain-containing protein [Niallia circulans]|uniref:DUF4025 domain-containing protein n=1 Tax=Niallia circulans TaxID=1397 RepID=A0A553SJU1_NIACI|nr:YozQ family protein [Niallia circulans]TRZ37275.1 DUF4025 domain-containing protein [Niallia circulans]